MVEESKFPEHMPCQCPRCKAWQLVQQLNRSYFNCLQCGKIFKLFQYRGRRGYEAVK